MTRKRARVAGYLAIASLALAAAASLALGFVPFYQGVEVRSGGPPQSTSATLIEVNGTWVIIPLLVPSVLAAAGVIAALRRPFGAGRSRSVLWVCGALLLAFCLASSFSIGLFYAPAAVTLLAAAAVSGRSSDRPSKPRSSP